MVRKTKAQERPDLTYEFALQQNGCVHVAGLDEAGRGAWAGPVVAAAVVLPLDRFDLPRLLEGVRDSKQMSPAQRELWASRILQIALAVGVGEASSEEIDSNGLIAATRSAMSRAITELSLSPEHLLIDHLSLPEIPLPQTALTRGDSQALSISAASIIAKTNRDHTMVALDAAYPGYGFDRHKGYGTADHRSSLARFGPCPIHRCSYSPVAACNSNAN